MLDAATALDLALFASILIAAAVVHGALGLGFPLISTPLLSIFVDVRTAILITLLPTIVVNVISIFSGSDWRSSIGKFWSVAVWVAIGGIAGSYLIAVNDPGPFKLLLAVLVFLYLAVDRSQRAVFGFLHRFRRSSGAGFGLVAGISAGATNTMVPIMIIYALEMGWSRATMVPVFNLFFLTGKATQVGVFSTAGIYDWHIAAATVPLAAVSGLAILAGKRFRDRIESERYRRIIKGALFVVGVILVIQFFQAI